MPKLGRAASLMLAFGPTLACSRVIGLGADYYEVTPQGGMTGDAAGNEAIAGAGGRGANAGSGGADSGGTAGEAEPRSKTPCEDDPITPRAEWVASASHHFAGDLPANLIDDTLARWSSGKPQSGDEWIQIDFGTAVAVRVVTLQQDDDPNDYPRMYSVSLSDTAQNLTASALASGEGTSGASTLTTFSSPHVGRYLVVKQLGMSVSWWSVDELQVSCTDN